MQKILTNVGPGKPEAARKDAHAQALNEQRQAAAYVTLALKVIPLAESADDLRAWWNDEQWRRAEYGLTKAHTQALIEACAQHVHNLGEARGGRS